MSSMQSYYGEFQMKSPTDSSTAVYDRHINRVYACALPSSKSGPGPTCESGDHHQHLPQHAQQLLEVSDSENDDEERSPRHACGLMLLSRRSLTSWSYLVAALQQTIARRRRPQGHSLAEELMLQGDEPGPQQHLQHGHREHAEGVDEGPARTRGHPPTYERVSFAEGCWRLLRLATWDIIYPDSYFRMAWDTFLLLLLLYVAIVLPYTIGFDIEYHVYEWLGILDGIVNVSFFLDILLNFRTAVRLGDDAVRRHLLHETHGSIAWHYATGWLALDLVAALPYKLISDHAGAAMQLVKLPRLLRLVRLLRVFKLRGVLRRSDVYRNAERRQGVAAVRVCCYAGGAALALHVASCAWFFAAVMEQRANGDFDGTWVAAAGIAEDGPVEQYITSLYFVVITFTTVGYGDIVPVTAAERFLACVGMLLGIITLAYVISTASTIMGTANKYEVAAAELGFAVDDFLDAHAGALPTALGARVKAFYAHVAAKQHNNQDDMRIMQGLPTELRRQVVGCVGRGILRQLPLLSSCGAVAPGLAAELAGALRVEFHPAGECVVMEGGWDTELYFIREGRLHVTQHVDTATAWCLAGTRTTARAPDWGEAGAGPAQGPDAATQDDGHARGEGLAGVERGTEAGPVVGASPFSMEQQEQEQQQGGTRVWNAMLQQAGDVGQTVRLRTLEAGDYFGEYGCLTGCPRTASVVAAASSELCCLRREQLAAALAAWPQLRDVWQRVEDYAAAERSRLRPQLRGGHTPPLPTPGDAPHPLHPHRPFHPLLPGLGRGLGGHSDAPGGLGSQARYEAFVAFFDPQGAARWGMGPGAGQEVGGGL